ncbi:CopD family protein [Actinosynnema pretiosum subsp. pretiosum]|uniref:CopD family protein n=1 Tax=Actinosynnema pretiosum subsp. pretiosum TaxID=103721 RepID=A0AA45L2Z0_9PSEU|nr:Copper resistance protein CopD [Actinosynnema pretiosum subsp. pretiosum]QUF01870.1 CopD family protein [Actinosynnema pretiosum subsp. pretiosum]
MTADRTSGPARPRARVAGGLLLGALAGVLVGLAIAGTGAAVGGPGIAALVAQPLARVLLDLSATGVVGLSLLPRLLGAARPSATEPVLRLARPAAVVLSAVWALVVLLSVVLRAHETRPDVPLTTARLLDYVQRVPAGQGLLFSAVCAVVCLGVGAVAVRRGEAVPAELRVLVALFGLLPLPATGHASNRDFRDVAVVAMELHVLGAALWTGGLVALVVLVAHRRGLLAEALPRFSRLATAALLVVTATGIGTGLLELAAAPGGGLPGSLVTTPYGLLLVGKALCALALAGLGARIRWWLLPLVRRHRPTALVGWAAAELAVMGAAFGLAVVLSRAPVA